MRFLLILFILATTLFSQEIIDISVKGISNEKKDGAQKDRLEAILDAKRQACEKVGLKIESKTTVENFQIVYDFIESEAETVLMPGFLLVDIGYVEDGTYQVVLSGKIQVVEEEEKISIKELRYAKSLKDRGKHSQCEAILKKYIDGKEEDISDELKEEAFYHFIKWGYSFKVEEDYYKFESYYPESKHLTELEKFAKFTPEPVYTHSVTYNPTAKEWIEKEYIHKKDTFNKQIEVARDTIIFKDFRQNEKSLILKYTLFSTNEKEPPLTAYELIINYYSGNIKIISPAEVTTKDMIEVDNRFKVFYRGGSPTFQHSASGGWFDNFKLKYFQIKGNTPVGDGPFTQKMEFKVYQKSF